MAKNCPIGKDLCLIESDKKKAGNFELFICGTGQILGGKFSRTKSHS